MDDKDVLLQLKKGEMRYLEILIKKYSNYLACVIKNIGRTSFTKEDIEELVADVFILFWKNINDFDFSSKAYSLKGYLTAIARNNTINRFKQKKIEYIPMNEDLLCFAESEKNDIEKKEQELTIKNCVLKMDEPDKSIFIYRYYYFLKIHEIAKKLFIKPKTVEARLLRGRDKLKKIIVERGFEFE